MNFFHALIYHFTCLSSGLICDQICKLKWKNETYLRQYIFLKDTYYITHSFSALSTFLPCKFTSISFRLGINFFLSAELETNYILWNMSGLKKNNKVPSINSTQKIEFTSELPCHFSISLSFVHFCTRLFTIMIYVNRKGSFLVNSIEWY